jgi:hypothetical protein
VQENPSGISEDADVIASNARDEAISGKEECCGVYPEPAEGLAMT